jgi:hypothetical protein
MTRPTKPPFPTDEPAVPVDELGSVLAAVAEPISRHPDGYYWCSADGRRQFGPFATYADAYADRHGHDPDDVEPGESLHEAESELGIADWIDPDSGVPAEGLGRPHLAD